VRSASPWKRTGPGTRSGRAEGAACVTVVIGGEVEEIEGARHQHVGVGIEDGGKLRALVAQVALDLELAVAAAASEAGSCSSRPKREAMASSDR
jgi:hypothetical protein